MREYTIYVAANEDVELIPVRRSEIKNVHIFSVKKKTLKAVTGVMACLIVFGIFLVPNVEDAIAQSKINCGDFPNRMVAQTAFDLNQKFYKRLDRDGDKKVCETYNYKNK